MLTIGGAAAIAAKKQLPAPVERFPAQACKILNLRQQAAASLDHRDVAIENRAQRAGHGKLTN